MAQRSRQTHPPSALITGGAGFIGSHLARKLLELGWRVTVIDDLSTGNLRNVADLQALPRFKIVTGKVSRHPRLDHLIAEAEAVFHLAAAVGVELVIRSPIRTIQTNLRETEALLTAASRHKTPVLIASTSEVYGKSNKSAFSEEDDLIIGPPYLGRWSYACSKLMDEFMAMAASKETGLPVIIARLFNTVGPGQSGRHGMVLPRFVAAACRNQSLVVYGSGRQTRCFCSVHDTVAALIKLARTKKARGQVYNIGSDQEISILQLARLVIRVLGSSSRIDRISYDEAYEPGFQDMLRRKPDLKKLNAAIGWKPATSLPEIIRLMASHHHGWKNPSR